MASTQVFPSRLGNLPVSFFAMVMGLSGLTIAWQKAVSLGYLELPALPRALLFFTAGVFILLAMLYTAKVLYYVGLFMTLVMFTQMPRFVRLRFSLVVRTLRAVMAHGICVPEQRTEPPEERQ